MRVGDYTTYCANFRDDNRRPCKQQACSMTFSNLPVTLFELGHEAVQYVNVLTGSTWCAQSWHRTTVWQTNNTVA